MELHLWEVIHYCSNTRRACKFRGESEREALHLAKKKDEIIIRSSAAEYLTYVASVGDQQDSIEMYYEDENIWLTQKMMATLYDVGLPTINEHIKKIYADSELEEAATISPTCMLQPLTMTKMLPQREDSTLVPIDFNG